MKQYFYVDANNQSVGPFPIEDLIKKITPETFVWTEGMENWAKANAVPEVMNALTNSQQPTYQQPPYIAQQPYQQPAPNFQQPNYQQQQYQQYDTPGESKPNNYLVWSILSIVLCCWPIGIAAVVYAAKVDSLWGQGRHNESRAASEKAKNLTIISAICGIITYVIYIILIVSGSLEY